MNPDLEAANVEEFLEDPVFYVCLWFEEYQKQFGPGLSELRDVSLVHFLLNIHPGVEVHVPTENKVYYQVEEWAGHHLAGAAQSVPEAAEMLVEICAANVFNGAPLPSSLRSSAHSLIGGAFPLAKRSGPPIHADFLVRCLLYGTALCVHHLADGEIDLTHGDAKEGGSACDIVCEAAREFNVPIKYTTLRDWCTQSKYQAFRTRYGVISSHFRDLALRELGFDLRTGPIGLFHGMGRMT